MQLFSLSLVISLIFSPLLANPFKITVPTKEKLTIEDYVEVQKQLQALDVAPAVKELYVPGGGFPDLKNFEIRCLHGAKQTIIDVEKGLLPIRELKKIGKGSDLCIVSWVPFAADEWGRPIQNYAEYLESTLAALKETNYNGYFFYMVGGFPNPTGKEIQYAAVPYAAKIFMMLEAQKLGFKKVLWIDSSILPLRNPTPFFVWIETRDYFLRGWTAPTNAWSFILPATRVLLHNELGVDVVNTINIDTRIFGLRMDTPLAEKLIADYYRMVELGKPFLSCFPEDFVLSAILGQPEFNSWKAFNMDVFLQSHEQYPQTPEKLEFLRKEGCFFYQRAQ
jgi:hypothetical protein